MSWSINGILRCASHRGCRTELSPRPACFQYRSQVSYSFSDSDSGYLFLPAASQVSACRLSSVHRGAHLAVMARRLQLNSCCPLCIVVFVRQMEHLLPLRASYI